MKTIIALFALIAVSQTSGAALPNDTTTRAPFVRIDYERLPDLNIPRAGHHTYYAGGELTVMGGHTTGFKPTRTTEYFDGHEWHVIPMTYDHDDALALQLSSGKVLIGGGHGQPLGIEQTFPTEIYDPATHEFGGFGCLDVKRVLANAVELDSSRIVISGNWYHDDAIELFDGKTRYQFVDSASQDRSCPFVLQTSPDNVMIFSNSDIRGNIFDSIIVDQLEGESFSVPLFETWRPLTYLLFNQSSTFFIGDADAGVYSYLFLAADSLGQYGIVRTLGTQFELLHTVYPIPLQGVDGADIKYWGPLIVDRNVSRAYLMGFATELVSTSWQWIMLTIPTDAAVPSPFSIPTPSLSHTPVGHIPCSTPMATSSWLVVYPTATSSRLPRFCDSSSIPPRRVGRFSRGYT